MTFIVTLIALLIERFFDWSHVRHWGWFVRYQQFIGPKIAKFPPYATLAASILPLLIVVGLLQLILTGWMYGLFKLVFDVLLLVYCFGPSNLWAKTYAALNDTASAGASAQTRTRDLFVAANQHIFAVWFWYIVLGPIGAVLYRSLAYTAQNSPLGLSPLAAKAVHILDWLPARVFAFVFALGGHFMGTLTQWKKYVGQGVQVNEQLLADCGVAALDAVPDNVLEKSALALLDRTWIIGLVLSAAITLF